MEGSNGIHFFVGEGETLASAKLRYRNEVCGCLPCLESPSLISRGCTLTHLVGVQKSTQLQQATAARRIPTRATSGIRALALWLPYDQSSRTLERVVVLRIHREDPNDKNEAYFLGRPVQKAYQLGMNGPLAGKKHMQGEWVTAVKWYELEKILDSGDRVYSLNHLPTQGEVYVVKGIVDIRFVSFFKYTRTGGGQYYLAGQMHQRILAHGDLDA